MVSIKEIKKYFNKDVNLTLKLKINKFFAAYTAKILLYTPITGHQVSFLMIFLAIVMCVLFSFGKFWYSVIGLILLFFQINLDSIDGLIVRYREGKTSVRGRFIDLIIHSISESLVFFGLTLGVFRNTNNIWFLIFGMLATLFISLCSTVRCLKYQAIIMRLEKYANGEKLDELINKKLEKIDIEEGKSKKFIFWKKIAQKILLFLKFEYFPLVLIFSIIFNFTKWVLVFYGVALPIKWLIAVFYEFKIGYKNWEYLFKPYKPK